MIEDERTERLTRAADAGRQFSYLLFGGISCVIICLEKFRETPGERR
jgi:hypothetical protein